MWIYEQNEEIRRVDREMTQWLKVLGALTKDPRSVPNSHMVVHNHLLLSLRGSDAFFQFPQAPCMNVVQIYINVGEIFIHTK